VNGSSIFRTKAVRRVAAPRGGSLTSWVVILLISASKNAPIHRSWLHCRGTPSTGQRRSRRGAAAKKSTVTERRASPVDSQARRQAGSFAHVCHHARCAIPATARRGRPTVGRSIDPVTTTQQRSPLSQTEILLLLRSGDATPRRSNEEAHERPARRSKSRPRPATHHLPAGVGGSERRRRAVLLLFSYSCGQSMVEERRQDERREVEFHGERVKRSCDVCDKQDQHTTRKEVLNYTMNQRS
jgi:hypothetical protein